MLSLFPPFVRPRRLGDCLCRAGIITREQLRKALERQKIEGHRLGYNLISLGYLDEDTLANFLSEQYRVPAVILHSHSVDPEAAALLDMDYLSQAEAIPVKRSGNALTLAMVDPSDVAVVREIEAKLSVKVNPVVASQSAIRKALAKQRIKATLPPALASQPEMARDEAGELFSELEDYKVIGMLGQGGFAKVYKCVQLSLDRFVAIKTLSKSKIGDNEIVERFRREGRIVARLNHVNIVKMIDQGEIGDMLYMVMEHVEGVPLDDYLDGKPFEERLDAIIQVCDALAYAHGENVLHRDIKPSNILVDFTGLVRLLDFGIAVLMEGKGLDGPTGTKGERLTRADVVMGTPQYMAPEQRANMLDIDERADLYSLGVIMFEVFTNSTVAANPEVDPQELNPEIPLPLAQIIRKCLATSREDRPASSRELKEFLLELRDRLGEKEDTLDNCLRHAVAQNHDILLKERYTFLSEIKQSQGRRVILAEHKTLQRLICVKKLETKAGLGPSKILARVKHPHVGEILGVGEAAGAYLIVSEFLSGGSLADRIKLGHPFRGDQALGHALSMAEALEFAQGLRIAHGHLHPDNVLFAGDGTLKIVDFGMPAACDPAMERFFANEWTGAGARTRDPFAGDRFSLGVILYEMISGRRFNPDKDPAGQYAKLQDLRVQPPRLRNIVQRLWNLAPPDARYADAGDLVRDLRSLAKTDGGEGRKTARDRAQDGPAGATARLGEAGPGAQTLRRKTAVVAMAAVAGAIAWGIWRWIWGR